MMYTAEQRVMTVTVSPIAIGDEVLLSLSFNYCIFKKIGGFYASSFFCK